MLLPGQNSRQAPLTACAVLLCAMFFLCSALAAQVAPQPRSPLRTPPGLSNIQHFVFIMKENRSFDHYFGKFPGADGATTATLSTGQVVPLTQAPDQLQRDLCHSWQCGVTSVDYGRMDKFDVIVGPAGAACNINGDYECFTQMSQQDIPNYYAMASYFTLADHTFSSIHGTSVPNHQYMVAAQSGGAYGQPMLWTTGDAEPMCDAPPGTTISVIDAQGNTSYPFPCFDYAVLSDSLQAAGISWKLYSPAHSFWNPLDGINHVRNTNLWNTNVVLDTQFAVDAAAGNLPAVSWVIPLGSVSEHPANSTCVGENWAVEQLQAVMNGPDWNTTAVFLAWDDWDGLYDHVPPPQMDQYGLGPRVPMIIISPYSKSGYISHTTYEFSSYLKLIEERYNLAPLTNRDAAANDMLDSFDFNQSPLPPLAMTQRACNAVSPNAINFSPPQNVNTTSPSRGVIIGNYGSTNLTVSNVSLSGADFSATNPCSVVPPRSTCTINVSFTPLASGTRTGSVTITDSDPSSPQTVTLSGVGTNVSFSSSLLSFGTILVGNTSLPQTATFTNSGTTTLTISSIVGSGDYSETDTCGTSLAPGGSCTVTVRFTPTATGVRYGTVTFTDSDGSAAQVLNLTGTGTLLTLTPTSLNFGTIPTGQTSTKNVQLTNGGTSALAITNIQLLGSINQNTFNYTQTNTCGSSLPAGSTCTISVTFVPQSPLVLGGQLLITDSESNTSPQIVSLTGTGQANPVPLISLPFIPGSATPGAASFTLTVKGANFNSGSTVNWNGSPLTTTFVSKSTITATVPASDLVNKTTGLITVSNKTPGGGVSNLAFFPVMNPSSSVASTKSDIASSSTPRGVAVGDFDKNGILDLAVANSGSNTVSIFLGNGDGTFSAAGTPTTGATPVAVVVGDFNADGNQDLAIANSGDNTLSILLGNGNGTFSPAVGSPTAVGLGPVALAVGDFNRDGRLDIAIANNVESNASVLLGQGDGSFIATSAGADTGVGPDSVMIGDFDSDTNVDLVLVDQTDKVVAVRPGRSDGSFTTAADFVAGNNPSAVVTGDFNGDGHLDLAVANQADNTISVFLGNGDNTFSSATLYATGTGPAALALGDFNADGKLDLATANQTANTVSILLGNADGTFQNHVDTAVGTGPTALATGDFNRDGLLDLAVTNGTGGTLSILLQNNSAQGVTLLPASLTFPTQLVGTSSATQTLTLTNNSTSTLTISSISIKGDFTKTTNCSATLAVGASCAIRVTFKPTTSGTRTGTLTVNDSAPGGSQTATLSGTGTFLMVSPTSISFPTTKVGKRSLPSKVTLTNNGTTSLQVTSITISGANAGDFNQMNTCTSPLLPGGTCTVTAVFAPTAVGARSATLSIVSSDGGNPTVALSGTGN